MYDELLIVFMIVGINQVGNFKCLRENGFSSFKTDKNK